MIIVKHRLKDLENFIKKKKYIEAFKFLLAYDVVLKNLKNKEYIENILEKLNSNEIIEKFLKIYLEYYIHLDKYKFFEQFLKLNMKSFFDSTICSYFIHQIVKKFYNENDLPHLLHRIFYLEKDDNIQKNKYFALFILFHNLKNKKIWFENLELFKKHQKELINKDREELLLTFNTYTNHIFLNFSQIQSEFDTVCETFDKLLSNYLVKKYKHFFDNQESNNNNGNNRKNTIKIAFIMDKVVNNSPNEVLYAFLKNLLEFYREKVKVYLIDANQQERVESKKEVAEKFKRIGVRYINLKEITKNKDKNYNNWVLYSRKMRCEEAYNFIKKENIDIIIFGNSLYLSIYLAARRAAPIQIYWSHGNANWNVNGIDIRISHFPQNSKYVYFIFEEPRLKEFYIGHNPKLEKEIAKRIRKSLEQKYGKDIVILGTIGRFIKLQSEEYIKLICDVMKKYKNTIYLACGKGCDIVKDLILKYGGEEVLSRWIFPGQVNPHIYGWVIDIWPDTFPLRQGKSLGEFEAKKGCTIIYSRDSNKNLKKYNEYYYDHKLDAILYNFELESFFFLLENIRHVRTLSEYKQKLELLIKDKNFRKNLSMVVTKYYKVLFSQKYRRRITKLFYSFLRNLQKS